MSKKPRRPSSKKRSKRRARSGEASEPKNPHDRLFKRVLSSPRHAADELRAVLPPELTTRIDWTSLRVEPGSYISREQREYHTDLLFSASVRGRSAYIYLLLEHQSTPDPWMPLRMLAYIVQIWESLRRQEPERTTLPLVIPVVLHHGEWGWTVARRLGELLDWDEELQAVLRAHVPDFEVIVDDLARLPERALLERDMRAASRLLLWILRAVRVGFDARFISQWARAIDETETSDREALRDLLRYLTSVDGGEIVLRALIDAGVSEGVQEVVMGLRREWEEQGRKEGREEGRNEGRKEGRKEGGAALLLTQLRLKFVDLPPEAEERVRNASAAAQERWAERILTAETLDDVWG